MKVVDMAPLLPTNGTGFPLTEYSAGRPVNESTEASKLVPEAFLLRDGHPDVHIEK